jgi:hypothetical protein
MAEPSIFTRATDNNDKAQAGPSAVDKFLEKATGRSQGVGRIVFAIDATASRGPTWDMARGLTGDMIREATSVGRLELQLVFFRGGSDSREECVASDWISDPTRFAQIIAKVECRAGYTQITRALAHGRRETTKDKVNAMVLIGDACEPVEDTMDSVSVEAAELGRSKLPVFAFLEGRDALAETGFHKIAELSGGAFGRFDAGGVKQLGELIKAVAAFAAGGAQALEGRQDEASMLLLEQMRRNG